MSEKIEVFDIEVYWEEVSPDEHLYFVGEKGYYEFKQDVLLSLKKTLWKNLVTTISMLVK